MCKCKHSTVLGMSWKITFTMFILQMSKPLVRSLKVRQAGLYCTVLKEVICIRHTHKQANTFIHLKVCHESLKDIPAPGGVL